MGDLFEYYNTGDDTYTNLYHDGLYAQTFTIGAVGIDRNFNIVSVKLKMFRSGTPGIVNISIKATDVDGKPTGNDLSIGTINADTFTTDTGGAWYEITMSSLTLLADTKYAIVAKPNSSGSNYTKWRYDSSGEYSGGSLASAADSVWTLEPTMDFMFEVWGDLIRTKHYYSQYNYNRY